MPKQEGLTGNFVNDQNWSVQLQNQVQAQEEPLSKLLREYRDAKIRFDTACKAASAAINERDQASIALNKLSEVLTQTVQSGLYDPTVPQPAVPTVTNGSYTSAAGSYVIR